MGSAITVQFEMGNHRFPGGSKRDNKQLSLYSKSSSFSRANTIATGLPTRVTAIKPLERLANSHAEQQDTAGYQPVRCQQDPI
jgi:hypothetical protein